MNYCFYNPSVSLRRATSLYTREAYHHPAVHLRGVTHYTLQSKECEKEYEQNCPYSFCYFFGRCCPLRVILSGVRPRFHLRFARCCFAVRLRYASLRMTRRTQSKPEGRTAMPFGSRREIKTFFMGVTASVTPFFVFTVLPPPRPKGGGCSR